MISATVLGSILGFAGSAIAPIVDIFNKKTDAKLTIQKMDKAAALKQAGFDHEQVMYTLTARDSEHERLLKHDIEISKAGGFLGFVQRLVRPLITYAFFGLFVTVEITVVKAALDGGMPIQEAVQYIWTEDTKAIFATIITFWFGNRVFEKKGKA